MSKGDNISLGGTQAQANPESAFVSISDIPTTNTAIGLGYGGARIEQNYINRTEDAIAVRRIDLEQLSKFGWLEEGIGGAGMFFLSGALWLLLTLLAEHHDTLLEYVPWFVVCVIAMAFGGVLLWISSVHFALRKGLIESYFNKKTLV